MAPTVRTLTNGRSTPPLVPPPADEFEVSFLDGLLISDRPLRAMELAAIAAFAVGWGYDRLFTGLTIAFGILFLRSSFLASVTSFGMGRLRALAGQGCRRRPLMLIDRMLLSQYVELTSPHGWFLRFARANFLTLLERRDAARQEVQGLERTLPLPDLRSHLNTARVLQKMTIGDAPGALSILDEPPPAVAEPLLPKEMVDSEARFQRRLRALVLTWLERYDEADKLLTELEAGPPDPAQKWMDRRARALWTLDAKSDPVKALELLDESIAATDAGEGYVRANLVTRALMVLEAGGEASEVLEYLTPLIGHEGNLAPDVRAELNLAMALAYEKCGAPDSAREQLSHFHLLPSVPPLGRRADALMARLDTPGSSPTGDAGR